MKMFDVYPLNNIAIERAQGSWVFDEKDQQYLDMYGGHAVISIGHTNPDYVSAVEGQLEKIGFYSNSVIIPIQRKLCDALARVTGRDDYQLFMCNSGAEANENAMKLASFHTGRKKIVAFSAAFHGRTSLAVAATDNKSIVAPVNETDNIIFLPFNDVEALEALFAERGGEIAAVISETIQGVGGIFEASERFIVAISSLCKKYGALYIADSVQDGCGRSGKYFASDWYGVDADIYTMAKGVGNGFPVGATLIAPHIAPKHGALGTTFGGNQLACAAAIAVAEVIERDNLIESARKLGDYIIAELKTIPNIAQIRGKGLMIGIELPFDSGDIRKRLLFEKRIFVGAAGKKSIRLLPALNITKEQVDIFLGALRELLTNEC